MKQIKFSLAWTNGKKIGSFTLDPLAQILLMAMSGGKEKALAVVARDLLREPLLCDQKETTKAISESLA